MEERIAKKDYEIRKIIFQVIVYSFLALFALFVLIPFYWMILTSLKTAVEVTKVPPSLFIPFSEMRFLENYTAALAAADYYRYMLNTVTVAAISTTVQFSQLFSQHLRLLA